MIQGLLAVLLSCTFLLADPPPEALNQEARSRHDRNVQEGFNLTFGFTFKASSDGAPLRTEFLVPATWESHRLSLWLKTQDGEAGVRLLRGDGTEVFAWAGKEGELTLTRRLAVGKYTLEITAAEAQGGRAEFAVKGPLMEACARDAERCAEIPAAPGQGFHWPYLLYTPKQVKVPYLLVVPLNTGFAVDNLDLLRASGNCEVRRDQALADRLGCTLLVPLFPRPSLDPANPDSGNLYLHALSRPAMVATKPEWKRVDLQLLGMIDDARTRLGAQGRPVQPKVLMSGFSASGMFVNRFGLLHPERVLAVACGSPGGWPMAPIDQEAGETLPYPVGSGDLKALVGRPLDTASLEKVNWFFFLGDEDHNDAVVSRDSFAKSDEEIIMRRFGTTLVERWRQAGRLYSGLFLPAVFRLYKGSGHVVTEPMEEDRARFFEKQLAGAKGQKAGR